MTIAQALKMYSRVEVDLLLGHVLKQSKEFLYMRGEKRLTVRQQKQLASLAAKRKKGMPIAYLVGHKFFYGLKFKVTPEVLIPRPESEWLVEKALEITRSQSNARILDVGTGSGAIAISIATFSNAKVFASDISSKALTVAKANAKTHGVKVVFARSDLLKEIKGQFNLIIANLPYVPAKEYKRNYKNLKFEPKSALVDSGKELDLYKKFITQMPTHLIPGGTVLLEIDPSAKKPLQNIIKKVPEKNIQFFSDIHDPCRFARIT